MVDGDDLALVMELVEGRPLSEVIGEAAGPVPWERAWPLFEPLLGAVGHAHEHGVVHRDLKPENVVLDAAGRPRVIDFGIARDLDAAGTRTGTSMGTVEYMAPEQYTDATTVDRRADVYSLGMILYETLAGRLPWEASATQFEILEQKARKQLRSPSAFCPDIPPEVVAALSPALGSGPGGRPDSTAAFAVSLAEAGRRLVADVARPPEAAEDHPGGAPGIPSPGIPSPGIPSPGDPSDSRPVVLPGPVPGTARRDKPDVAPSAGGLSPHAAGPGAASVPVSDGSAQNRAGRRRAALVGGALTAVALVGGLLLLVLVLLVVIPGSPLRGSSDGSGAEEPVPAVVEEPVPAVLEEVPNPAGIDWVRIEGGTFQIGSDDGGTDEKNGPRITVPTFEMSRSEVTVGQYMRCVEAGESEGGCSAPHWDDGSCGVWDGSSWGDGVVPQSFRAPDQPIVCVTHDQARTFAHWAGGCVAGEYCRVRLPSESEWEFAARSRGQNRKYPWGDEIASCEYAVMDDGGYGCGEDRTWDVCRKSPGNTDEGLCDMSGNVSEWVEDCYESNYVNTPADGAAWDPVDCESRVLRNRSWATGHSQLLRATKRNSTYPSSRTLTLGFRLARPPS